MVWRPPNRIRRRPGVERRRADANSRAADAVCLLVGEGRQKTAALQEIVRAPARKATDAGNRARGRPDRTYAREIDRAPRVRARGEEERRRWAYLELRLAAPLLQSTGRPPLPRRQPCIARRCLPLPLPPSAPPSTLPPSAPSAVSSPPAVRSRQLLLRLAVRPCRGACRALPPRRPPLHLRLTAPPSGSSAWYVPRLHSAPCLSALLVCCLLCLSSVGPFFKSRAPLLSALAVLLL